MNDKQDMEKWGHAEAWSRELKIPIDTLRERLQGVRSRKGRNHDGEVTDFYPEDDVRRACADLLGHQAKLTAEDGSL